MSADLAAWLLEQITADRVIAEDAARDWIEGQDGDEIAGQPDSILVGTHLVRWSPGRVLAECDARRRLIELHSGDIYCVKEKGGTALIEDIAELWGGEPCQTLKLMALPYSNRPGYRQEWRP